MKLGDYLPAGLGHSEVIASGDFETYSEAGYKIDYQVKSVRGTGSGNKGGLPAVGTPVYAEHPSAEVLCFVYDLKDGGGRRLWVPGMANPFDLFDYLARGGLFEAWNVTFEWYIWNMVCARKYGWPPLPLAQCRCAMAKARRFSLPGGLDKAAGVLGTPQKDPAGHNLVRKLTRPQKPTKARPEFRHTPANNWADFQALYAYCDQDIVAEDGASAHIPDLTDYEHRTWLLDQTVNARGVQVDVQTLDAALDILDQTARKYTRRLAEITDGAVGSASEVAKILEWLASHEQIRLPDLRSETVTETLRRDLPPVAREVLEIRAALASANVKKLPALRQQVSSDGRLRDQYTYCGADRTGRWASGGVQLQNMTAKGPEVAECESCERIFGYGDHLLEQPDGGTLECPRCGSWLFHTLPEWNIQAVEQAIEDIRTRDLVHVEEVWGAPIAVLCGCLRGLFTAREGHTLICCDFSAIEAVAAACLSRCQWRIDVFNTPGACIYTQSASKITGTPLEVYQAYRHEHGGHHPDRKKIGKIAELASGYGGWLNAWRAFGADMEDSEIKQAILAWREASPEIVEMWGGQFRWVGPGKWHFQPELFGLEGAAIQAILNPGKCFSHIDITYGVHNDVLYCRLPSGRYLHYHRPRLVDGVDKLNRGPCYNITFEGYNSNPTKGPIGWHRLDTFGGRLFENVVQAVSCDIQAEALQRCEARGYPIVMHTHDEGTAEVPEGFGSLDEMCDIMAERPSWASWWPLRAAGWTHKRYQKD